MTLYRYIYINMIIIIFFFLKITCLIGNHMEQLKNTRVRVTHHLDTATILGVQLETRKRTQFTGLGTDIA